MMDDRIVYADLFGQRHPMCLTVSADALIVEEFGSLQQMWAGLRGEHEADVVDTYVELSAILMEGGRDRVTTLAKLQGENAQLPPVFDLRANWGSLTKPELNALADTALHAVSAGLKRTVEVAPSKRTKPRCKAEYSVVFILRSSVQHDPCRGVVMSRG